MQKNIDQMCWKISIMIILLMQSAKTQSQFSNSRMDYRMPDYNRMSAVTYTTSPPIMQNRNIAASAIYNTDRFDGDTTNYGNYGRSAAFDRQTPTTVQRRPNEPFKNFNRRLFENVSPTNTHTNIVYSPISLQTLLATVYIGANGNTARELQTALELPINKTEVAVWYRDVLNKFQNSNNAQLIVANKIIYNSNLKLNSLIKNWLSQYLNTDIESTQFTNPNVAAAQINAWVASKTQNRIPAIVSAETIDPRTSIMLLNAIYFKAKWAKEFSTMNTEQLDFYNENQRIVPVDMMYIDDTFRFAEMPDLNAKMLELPYKDSDLSMWIILPNAQNGLADLVTRLSSIENLNSLGAKLRPQPVTVRLPKFRIEFELDLMYPLQNMGIRNIFSNNAELNGFFPKDQAATVTKVLQKAYIDVNEAGSEAAATSFASLIPLALPVRLNYFTADHPFLFAIKSPQNNLFVGHVVNF